MVRDATVTTEYISRTLTAHGRPNHAVTTCQPLDLPDAVLPITPYVLGIWLGDGTTRDGSLTCADTEILGALSEAGYELRKWKGQYAYGVVGLTGQLKGLGVLGAKHIPRAYLRAGVGQRLALLQGLMDTDGTVNREGQCEISLSNHRLASDAHELLLTMGIKVACRQCRSSLAGRDAKDRYRMKFSTALSVFRLPRKLERQGWRREAPNRHCWRSIVAVNPAPVEPVKCIGVASASHLYLAGRSFIPTHNSWALTYQPVYHLGNPGFTCVTFRRTTPDIRNPGSLWDESMKMYPLIGGEPREHVLEWDFPSGARTKYAGLQHASDVLSWKSSQIALVQFDQLEEFEEAQFWYMQSRNRTTSGVKAYTRASCNALADTWLAAFIQWWWDPATGYAIEDRSGIARWYIRANDEVHWASLTCPCDTSAGVFDRADMAAKAELEARYPGLGRYARSFAFIRAKLSDNKIGVDADPDYEARVRSMPHVEQERLLGGNWKIRAAAGLVFNRAWFEIVGVPPARVKRRVRFWDKAGTAGGGDWTAGPRLSESLDGVIYVEDVERGQLAAGDRENLIKQKAQTDPAGTVVGVEQEPGSGGKDSAHFTVRNLKGFTVYADRPSGRLVERAQPLAAQAQVGNVKIVRGAWNETFLRELHAFPTPGVPDDQVASAAGAFKLLSRAATMGTWPTIKG
jgi:predicted phage terminase large subunit-like protein